MKYRNKANITLSLVLIAFILVALIKHRYPETFAIRLGYFVLEAALVGGLADWFAVTALFRKPLGFPYHTALIPRNREKVIQGVTKMVEGDLLSKASIAAKIDAISFDQMLIDLLEKNPDYKTSLIQKAGQGLHDYLINLDKTRAASILAGRVNNWLMQFEAGPKLQQALGWVLKQGAEGHWLNLALLELKNIVELPRTQEKLLGFLRSQKEEQVGDNVFKHFVAGILESTDSLNLEEAAKVLQDTLVQNLEEFMDPQHPVRAKLREVLQENIDQLAENEDWRRMAEHWKQDVLINFPLEKALETLIASLVSIATSPRKTDFGLKSPLAIWTEKQLSQYWQAFIKDQGLRSWLNHWCKEILTRVVNREHYLVGEIAGETLGALSNQDLNKFIEDKAGNDLQWIRINGSLIGGLIGLILFLVVTYVYDPWVVPVLNAWLK